MNTFIELMLKDGRIVVLPVGNCTFLQSLHNMNGNVPAMNVECNGAIWETRHTLTQVREELTRLELLK